MTRIISFSVWGDDPKYIVGAIENAKLAATIYPGWEAHFFCIGLAHEAYQAIADAGGCVRNRTVQQWKGVRGPARGLFYRFVPLAWSNCEYLIVRDCDSRLNWRERGAVDEWIASGKTWSVLRDHPAHRRPMLGGTFGARGNALPNFVPQLQQWLGDRPVQHDMDQHFLADVVWPEARKDCCVHDSMFVRGYWSDVSLSESYGSVSHDFPPHADIAPSRFVGDVILADGTPDPSIKDPGVL